ncbi:HD domain-containing protein [Flaviflagellibacter deserti]|uniref:HD domain-containing protein n=1 Tax=Flaviflagellibacter deserti TaxID=2267266 RepID=A0ABV9YXY5_9HYPH
MDKDQRIRDPIHNLIAFSTKRPEDVMLWELVQTAPVQRLRRIKQLGFSEFVYPGATHTRFSHVLGAMQMARRMLDVFERNQQLPADDHPRRRLATLAAALLHDVGHGPYSHVFEEVSSKLELNQSHEAYTLEIIRKSRTAEILDKNNILDETALFFEQESGNDPYQTIISSQLDCDRLDFLMRDRYYTGVRSTAIDLEWLLDSLKISKICVDPIEGIYEYSFVVQKKGVSVVEEFVLSYMKMYQNIYFHKTTRGVQHMASDIIYKTVSEVDQQFNSINSHPLITFFRNKDNQALDNYMNLDDSSVLSLVKLIADANNHPANALANRYLNRDTYKCLDLPSSETGEIRREKASKFIEALRSENIAFFADRLPGKAYKQYDVMDRNFLKNIMVEADGEHEPLGRVSQLVQAIPAKPTRIYFDCSKDRDRAKSIRDKMG